MSFESLGLSEEILRAIKVQGYNHPTPIQQKAIPPIIDGQDIMGSAQTGTGKTAGFTLPLLQRLNLQNPVRNNKRHIRALIMTPTRELAAQVCKSVDSYGQYLPLKTTVVFGGVKIGNQIRNLRSGVDVLVATPGRLLDHVQQRTVDLSKVEIFILDEADRMLDMGFIPDVKKIISLLPKDRQNLLFSATFSNEIQKLAKGLLRNPKLVEVAPQNTASEMVKQVVHHVDKKRKRELLSYMIGSKNWQSVLVFTRTKHGANRLAEQLEKDGLKTVAIHGNKSQGARTKALEQFKNKSVRVLVATDIAARGLDIDQLPHVVNYDLPNLPEDYVHRIGRTGRAGNEGEALSLVSIDEIKFLSSIERLLRKKIPTVCLEGFEVDSSIMPEQKQRRGSRGANRGKVDGRSNRNIERRSDKKKKPNNGFGRRRKDSDSSNRGNENRKSVWGQRRTSNGGRKGSKRAA